jgi:hypothetical protein
VVSIFKVDDEHMDAAIVKLAPRRVVEPAAPRLAANEVKRAA